MISDNNTKVLNKKMNDPVDHTSHPLRDVCTNHESNKLLSSDRLREVTDMVFFHTNTPIGMMLSSINHSIIVRLLLSLIMS